jgi:GntR family transcriptional regulator, vanillate catabolism transcriptional regulator
MSQRLTAVLNLRQLILRAELKPGERLCEALLAKRLRVSRTPVRSALVELAEEGLVELRPGGGYAVHDFCEGDVLDAIEIRGALEGMAARLAAQRGGRGGRFADLGNALAAMDGVVERPTLDAKAFELYVDLNARFHAALIDLAESPLLSRQYARAVALPFASPSGFVMAQSQGAEAAAMLTIAQEHHRAVVEAIEERDGGRAEALMREHARLAHRNLQMALRDPAAVERVPGLSLVKGRSARARDPR